MQRVFHASLRGSKLYFRWGVIIGVDPLFCADLSPQAQDMSRTLLMFLAGRQPDDVFWAKCRVPVSGHPRSTKVRGLCIFLFYIPSLSLLHKVPALSLFFPFSIEWCGGVLVIKTKVSLQYRPDLS